VSAETRFARLIAGLVCLYILVVLLHTARF